MAASDDADIAFGRFVMRSKPLLAKSAWFLCGDMELAADLVQETYVKTYIAWGRVRREEALAYARRVLVNVNIDHLRKRHGEVALADAQVIADNHDMQEAVAARAQVASWLAVLPTRQRQVVVLRYLQDLSDNDTAETLGISVGAVKTNASRALATLRSVIPQGAL